MVGFVEDLAPFFAEFGEDGALNGAPVRVIFDSPVDADPTIGITAAGPQVQIRTASVPAQSFGAVLALGARGEFRVRDRQDDGTGISRLLLTAL